MQWLSGRWKLMASVGAALTLYALLGFFLAPKLARDAIVDYVHNSMHRKIAIEELTFNPFTLTAQARNVALTEQDDTLIVGVDALSVNAELSSIFIGGAAFKEIRIDGPNVLVRIERDGSLNLAKLATPVTPTTESASPEGESNEIPRIRIGTFAINQGRIRIEDQSRPHPFSATLTPIQFSLSNFRTEPKFGNQYRFAAATEDKEELEWMGDFTVQPLGSNGRFTLTNIRAQTVAAYLQDALPFHLPRGLLNIQGEYRLAVQNRLDLQIDLPTIKAQNFALAARISDTIEAVEPWIVVPELTVADTRFSLTDRSVSVAAVKIDDAVLDVWREPDGGINLEKLFSPTATEEQPVSTEPQAAAESASWKIAVKSAQLERARIAFADKSIEPHAVFSLTPVYVAVTDYSNAADATLNVDANIGFDSRGEIRVNGPVALAPLAADLNVAVKNLDLALAQPYLARSTAMTLHSGLLTTQAFIGFAAEPPRGKPRLKITGDFDIDNLLTKDNALNEDFVKWQSLKITGVTFEQAPDRLTIARIQARQPYGRIVISEQGATNVSQILNPGGEPEKVAASDAKPVPAQAAKAPMPIRINAVTIEGGSANFADYSVRPSFAAEIGSLKGSIAGLSSDKDSRAKVQLTGSVDRYAPVAVNGELNLLASDKFSDIDMSFRNIELTTFNPYSGKFAGYNISKGKLTTEMEYKVSNRQLNARHHVLIDQLEFGDATDSKDAVSLPIKLAVALLKDRHGAINLDLPVQGNLDDPSFRIGPVVGQVLKNTVEKIVTAPFAMLGSLFGGGEELSYVDFAPGSSQLTPSETNKLAKLKVALVERPQLRLNIPLQASIANDAEALAKENLRRAERAAAKPNTERLATLTSIYTREFGKAPAYPENAGKDADVATARIRFLEEALTAKFAPTSAQLDELARTRSNAVRRALLTDAEVQPERIFLTGRAAAISPRGDARLELRLE